MARTPSPASQQFLTFIHRSKRFNTRATAAARGVMRGVARDAAKVYEKKHGVAVSPAALATAVRHLLADAAGTPIASPHSAKKRSR